MAEPIARRFEQGEAFYGVFDVVKAVARKLTAHFHFAFVEGDGMSAISPRHFVKRQGEGPIEVEAHLWAQQAAVESGGGAKGVFQCGDERFDAVEAWRNFFHDVGFALRLNHGFMVAFGPCLMPPIDFAQGLPFLRGGGHTNAGVEKIEDVFVSVEWFAESHHLREYAAQGHMTISGLEEGHSQSMPFLSKGIY